MYWIPFQIADYESDTKGLSPLEHGIYLLLLMENWKGKPLPKENGQLFRITSAFSQEEQATVLEILGQFFEEKSDGFWNQKAKEIYKNQKARSDKAQASAMKRWHANASHSHIHRQCKPESESESSSFINKTTTTPTPSGGCSSPFENRKLFTLKIRGVDQREDEWVNRCFIAERQSGRLSVLGCDNLQATMSLYPQYLDRWRRWLAKPDEERCAAIAYIHLKKQADHPFKYALKALEEGKEWQDFKPLLARAKKMMNDPDFYEVEING